MDSDQLDGIGSVASPLQRLGRPQTATDYVSHSLRRSILNGDLKGGTKLSLATLASTFDVSTTPVREALRELSHEGLVQLDSYRGGVVTDVTREDVEEIVRIRSVLEPMAVREVVERITPRILEEAEAILDEMARSNSWDVWVQGNSAFHQKLYEAAASRRLVSIVNRLQGTQAVFVSATLQRSPTLKDRATRDHQELLEAARDGDAEGMIEVTLRHLRIPLGE